MDMGVTASGTGGERKGGREKERGGNEEKGRGGKLEQGRQLAKAGPDCVCVCLLSPSAASCAERSWSLTRCLTPREVR